MKHPRFLKPFIEEALLDTPVVFINGPRQAGKSTLTKELLNSPKRAYLSFDDVGTLNHAKENPKDFLSAHDKITVDEVQRFPELFLTLKLLVDQDRRPGRFLLTGSANVLLLPKIADSLAGRMQVLTLLPLSCCEKDHQKDALIDQLFSDKIKPISAPPFCTETLLKHITDGGFPEVETRDRFSRKEAWFEAYITTLIERDIRDLANIEGLSKIPNLLRLIGTRTSTLLNFGELSRTSSMPSSTLKRYFSLLQALFLVNILPAWSHHLGKRLVKSPKVFISDTGLLCYLLGYHPDTLLKDHNKLGPILETFTAVEVQKRVSFSQTQPKAYYFRSQSGAEVDLILETRDGRCVGIEVKCAKSINYSDLKGLKILKQTLGSQFVRGIIFYLGNEVVHFEKDLIALPISALLH